jgi:long-chain acyl-CoA synthetase
VKSLAAFFKITHAKAPRLQRKNDSVISSNSAPLREILFFERGSRRFLIAGSGLRNFRRSISNSPAELEIAVNISKVSEGTLSETMNVTPSLPTLTLRAVLHQSADSFADRIALSDVGGKPYTYASFLSNVQTVSQLLHNRGVITGDRVAILSENKPQWGIAYFAVTTMGAIAVPILPDFHPAEIHHIVRQSDCRAIFVSSRLYEKLEDLESSPLTSIILIDDFSLIPPRTRKEGLKDVLEEGGREFAKLKELALKLVGRLPANVKEDDLAAIVYTSGTTGHSKGVMLTHKNIVSDALATTQIVAVGPEDRMLSILPLSHMYECTLGLVLPILQGAAIYYLDKPPSAGVLLPALETVKPTIMLSVPLVIEKMFKSRILPRFTSSPIVRNLYRVPLVRNRLHRLAGRKLLQSFGGKLKVFCIGGAPLAPEVELFLREARFPYAIGYGLTETSPLVVGTGSEQTRRHSAGLTLPGMDVRIDHPDPSTGEGEILVHGPTVMKGYYRDRARTEEVLTNDGWFKTGDLGVFDKDGYLYIRGRLKNMILGPNGKNIYPEEIESIINEFDMVLESLVFQNDNHLEARVYLNYEELDREFARENVVESRVREVIAERLENLRRQINERLSSFSRIQKLIEQREPFEKTPTQKIKRHLYV